MYIIKHEGNIRLIANCRKNNREISFVNYKVQIKVLWFWTTIKSFDEDDYADVCDCFRYCTNLINIKLWLTLEMLLKNYLLRKVVM